MSQRARASSSGAVCLLLTSCVAGGEEVRLGFGAGALLQSGSLDREVPDDIDPEVQQASGFAGFVEAEIVSSPSVLVRAVGSRQTHSLSTGTESTVEQWMTFGMLAGSYELTEHVLLRPLIGFGFGYVGIESDPITMLQPGDSAALAIAGGVELEVARTIDVGAMLWLSFIGSPGDTEAELSTGMLYVGFRF